MVDPNYIVNNVEVFVVDNIPVSGAHIARQSHVDSYPHLQEIKVVDLPVNEVSILMGTDFAPCFAPTEVRKQVTTVLSQFGALLDGSLWEGPMGRQTARPGLPLLPSMTGNMRNACSKKCLDFPLKTSL